MPSKLSHFFSLILYLSLLFLFLHGWFHFSNPKYTIPINTSNRKLLSTAKFDFTPFVRRHQRQHHHHRHSPLWPEPSGREIDPLYGAEQRLVPTGPNPLHH
ncbi:hypothetical protein M0R45_023475 [Rubus argutus]|uniref:CLAVATA3/ESR (CLE)-related protein 13 n=1 Tax=Rubus argutus TaxID=59490 RepID=A0AAW1WRF8_RUBAR